MGGYSAEREISLLSGNAVYQALIDSKIDCFSFDLNDKNLDELWKMKFNKAFIVLHGRGGEDGLIQSELNKKNIPFTGSNAKSSALCMDKAITKDLWKKHSLPISESIVVTKGDTLESISFPLPWAVKPTLEGSSIGITQVKNESELDSALEEAFKYGNQALVEQWIDGDEYTVSILNNNALPSIKITSDHDIYDYHSKYFSSKTQYLCPSDLTSRQELNLQNIALEAFNLTGASGWGRVDFILDKDRNPFLLEINTVPGMTSHSLVPMAAKASNMSFNDLVIKILNG